MASAWWIPVEASSWLLLLLLVLLTVFYLHLTSNFGYLEKQGVKVNKPWPLVGTLKIGRLIQDVEMENYKKFGRFYGSYDGRMPGLVVGDPELIRQITIKDFWSFPFGRDFPAFKGDTVTSNFLALLRGDHWKRMRTIMTPSFTTGKLKQMTYLIEECCKSLEEFLDKSAESGEPFDSRKVMGAFTMDVIANCAFGTKVNSMADPDNDFVTHAKRVFNPGNRKLGVFTTLFFPWLVPYIPIGWLEENPMVFFTESINKVIALKKDQKHQARRDFLELLLEVQAENEDENDSAEVNPTSKKMLTSELIVSQSIMFLLAGHQTMATLLSYALYALALNPEVQETLAEEVDRVLDQHQDKMTYAIIPEMQYLEMVICETLRMYPPVVRLERTCVEDGYQLNGVTLKNGMIVAIPIYAMHHDPENYPEPEKFDPERFSAENKASRDPFIYLPFGAGPRNCIGMRFAMTEAKIALAFIVRNFMVKRCPQTEVPPQCSISFGLLQPKSLTVTIERRKKK